MGRDMHAMQCVVLWTTPERNRLHWCSVPCWPQGGPDPFLLRLGRSMDFGAASGSVVINRGCVLIPEKAVSNSLCSSWLLRTDIAITGRTGLLRAPPTIFFSYLYCCWVQRKSFFTSLRSRTAWWLLSLKSYVYSLNCQSYMVITFVCMFVCMPLS